MTRNNFISVLRRFARESNIELVPVGDDFFELRLNEQLSQITQRKTYLQVYSSADGATVGEINFSCLCGVPEGEDRRFPEPVLREILESNRGGVMGTEFYFSTKVFNGHTALFLETRQPIEPEFDEDDAIGVLIKLWMSPLFVRAWSFPVGVHNLLW